MLQSKINNAFIEAYKSRNTIKKNTLGIIRTKISEWNADKKNVGKEISDNDIIAILTSEIKKRNQAIDIYSEHETAGSIEHIVFEKSEIEVLKEFLPQQMNESEMSEEIEKIKMTNPERLIASVMQHFNKNFKGKFDNKELQNLIKKLA